MAGYVHCLTLSEVFRPDRAQVCAHVEGSFHIGVADHYVTYLLLVSHQLTLVQVSTSA